MKNKTGRELIELERHRQISVEGWTYKHDDEYINGELSKAAYCYEHNNIANKRWPWDKCFWKPTTELRNRIKEGALLMADKDRIERRISKISAEIDRINNL